MLKIKRILKAAREKQGVNYNGTPIKLSADFSTQTLQARRQWREIDSKSWKGKICNLGYSTQQDYHLEYKERLRISQTSEN